ncbi:MAG: homoserine dehydrogenase [Geminicoccaceae bacterium]
MANDELLKIGVAGLGTVGAATVDLIRRKGDLLAQRTGRRIAVTAVSARERGRERGCDLSDCTWHGDARDLVGDANVDLVVELIGGSDGVALDVCRMALDAGKPLVTANKALLAHHGLQLAAIAESKGVHLGFEAAVAGGIPIVKSLREGLAANSIVKVQGILNGTCNYILSTMRESGRDFQEVLDEAQALGYAEADPSFDVDGIDAAHKLALLAALAYGGRPRFEAIHVEGIRHVSALDIAFAEELGYRIKLLGIARMTDTGLEQRLHPCMVPVTAPIARVDGVLNAVEITGDDVDAVMHEGRGAGGGPTASAVVSDIVDIARGVCLPVLGVPAGRLADHPLAPMSAHRGCYYIRLMVLDRPGVLADVAAVLRDHDISIEALIQRGRNPGQQVPIVFTSHEAGEAAMVDALDAIGRLEAVIEPPRMIRIEPT